MLRSGHLMRIPMMILSYFLFVILCKIVGMLIFTLSNVRVVAKFRWCFLDVFFFILVLNNFRIKYALYSIKSPKHFDARLAISIDNRMLIF